MGGAGQRRGEQMHCGGGGGGCGGSGGGGVGGGGPTAIVHVLP